MSAVVLKNICKIYDGGVKAVDNVNIDIEDQEFVVLVGPSGWPALKTSLLESSTLMESS